MQMTASLVPPRSRERRPGSARPAGDTAPPDLVPFDLTHLADLEPPPMLRRSLRLFAMAYLPGGPALTFVVGGKVVGCAGLIVDGGQARLWAFFSAPLSRRALKHLHRSFRRVLPKLKQLHGLRSIRAEVHPDDILGRRWLVYLGFRFDGVAAPCPLLGERMLHYLYR